MVVAVVADKALAAAIYHVSQENASLTPIFRFSQAEGSCGIRDTMVWVLFYIK
jgi:hypothetical protein